MDDGHSSLDDPLKVYLAELRNFPPLGREEEMECMRRVRAGDESAEDAGRRLVEANLQLVVTIAERYPPNQLHILDLIQAGNNGLLTAIQTLRDSSADSFPFHATPLIERAIAEAVAAPRRKIIPRHVR